MGTQQITRRLRAPGALVGMALLLCAAVAWPGCVDYGATRPCETDDDCYLGQTCDLGQGICVPLACVPACTGRACGDDGCGGSCGQCPVDDECGEDGLCHGNYPCCGTRECGPDPCTGVSCGACAIGEACDPTGRCSGDTPCCGARECGPDPCLGTSCGSCQAGAWCDATGACVWDCRPGCAGRECGPDGCGGSCGTCGADEWCDPTGLCRWDCYPDCAGRECGPDGCGGSCGTCSANEWCDASGICVWDCWPDCTGKACGDNGCGGSCGVCPPDEMCIADGHCTGCTPDCIGKECGLDGCGGSCGNCAPGEVCNADDLCELHGGTQQAGEPCEFDTVNVGAGACVTGLFCLGVTPDPTSAPCTLAADCIGALDPLWNADCVGGFCGASFCSPECENGACDAGFLPQTVSGLCLCIPYWQDPDPGLPGSPCAWDQVNPEAGSCMAGLTCLGLAPDPLNAPCADDADCAAFVPANHNADCVEGGCGASFCSGRCDADGSCATGFSPVDVNGTCYCIPDGQAGTGQPGDPCPFDQVNADASACAVGLSCLGIMPDVTSYPCPAGDEDCLDFFGAYWNLDCVDGGCGASFCSPPCDAGACDTGFDPYDISGDCYCVPNQ
jgi:hypothetical protein